MARQYKLVSGDSHLDLSPRTWTHRVPEKYQDLAPRVVKLANGAEAVQIGDGPPRGIHNLAHAGVPKEIMHRQIATFENTAGTGTPQKRVEEQDQDGVEAEILFSAVGNVGILRQVQDREAYLALNHAYNAYLAEEYSAAAPDRLFPMGLTPTSGVDDAVAELEYCARARMKGVQIDKFPSGRGLPTPEDDRFWAAALDLRMGVAYHPGGGSTRMNGPNEPTFSYKRGATSGRGDPDPLKGPDPMRSWYFRFTGEGICAPVQLAFAGVFDRFPNLQVYWAETMIGWLPYALWQVDENYKRYKYMAEDLYGVEPLERLPSEYIRDNNLWGFLSDPLGVELRHKMRLDNLVWGSDFPHSAGDWPHSREAIERDFAGMPEEERHLMVAGNAVRYFHLEE